MENREGARAWVPRSSLRRSRRHAGGRISYGRPAIVVAFVFALWLAFGSLLTGAGRAGAAPQVASTTYGGWDLTGDPDLGLGMNINRNQGILAWCVGDTQGGPYGTRGGYFVYTDIITINAGQQYVAGSTSEGPYWDAAGVSADNTGELAFLLDRWDEASVSDAGTAMHAHWAINSLSNVGAEWLHPDTPQNIKDAAAYDLNEARNWAGPYTVSPTVTLNADERGGEAKFAAKSAAGNIMNGYSYTAQLSGPALFDANGTKQVKGTTGANTTALKFSATGDGAVSVTVTVTGLPASSFTVLRDTVAQDLFRAGSKTTIAASSPAPNKSVVYKFAPTITAAVPATYINAGEKFADVVTAAAADPANDPWIKKSDGTFVAATAKGTLYGPYDRPQTTASTPPGAAPQVGTATVTFTGPGTKTVTSSLTAATSGYYTWSWKYDPNVYLSSTPSTGFFAAGETTAVRTDFSVTSQVTQKYLPEGSPLSSKVVLTPTSGAWPRDTAGTPIPVVADGTLYGPFDRPFAAASPVPAGAPVVGTQSVTVSSVAGATSGTLTAPNTGYYAWVWSVSQADQTGQAKDLVERDASSTFFAANSFSVAQMDLTVSTQVDADVVELGEPIYDNVTVGLAGDDDTWLRDQAGDPVPVTATGTLYGPYGTYQDRSPTVPAGAPVVRTEQLTFTGETTLPTTDSAGADDDGVYVWVWEITKESQSAAVRDLVVADVADDFFADTEDTQVRGAITMAASVTDDSGDLAGQVGEHLHVTYEIVNTTNTAVGDVVVTDSVLGILDGESAEGGFDGTLDPGEMVRFTGQYRVTQGDVDAGAPIAFTGTATGTNANGLDVVPGTAQTNLAASRANGLELTQSVKVETSGAEPAEGKRSARVAVAGDNLVYVFTVKNTGQDVLYDLEIASPLLSLELVSGYGDNRLLPGEMATFVSATNPVGAADVAGGVVAREAVATANDSAGVMTTSNMTSTEVPTSAEPVVIRTGYAGPGGTAVQTALLVVSVAALVAAVGLARRGERPAR